MVLLLIGAATWLAEYAVGKILDAATENFWEKIKSKQKKAKILTEEIGKIFSDDEGISKLQVSEKAKKVFESSLNQRLVQSSVFTKDMGIVKDADLSGMEFVDNKDEELKKEVRNIIFAIHNEIWYCITN